ncbi:MAG: biotin/lipoyl-containing protein [Burkholderiaceae bacterium]|nr:biotin/lipoyl-containing protein [Burkholderiaceae bacterium]
MINIMLDPVLWELVEAGAPAFVQEWLVSEGDAVHGGQTIAVIHVGQDIVPLPAPHNGTVEEILVGAGGSFTQGESLARLIAI